MPYRLSFLAAAVALLCLALPASAIVLEVRGGRVSGFLVNNDGKRLTIRVTGPDGQEKEVSYLLTEVKIVFRSDPKRLETLSRDDPKGYRTYADELAAAAAGQLPGESADADNPSLPVAQALARRSQSRDPEARYLARRLYLIAASLDPKGLGRDSLLRMSELSDDPTEARKCRALAFLLDPTADAELLKAPAVKAAGPTQVPPASLQELEKSLQQYRAGKVSGAAESAKRFGLAEVFRQAPGNLDQKAFLQWCDNARCKTCGMKGHVRCSTCNGQRVAPGTFGARQTCATCNGKGATVCTTCEGTGVDALFPSGTLASILRAELWALDQLAGDTNRKTSGGTSWSSALQARQVKPVQPLSLETITEFDPRKCHYRNGVWVLPEGSAAGKQ